MSFNSLLNSNPFSQVASNPLSNGNPFSPIAPNPLANTNTFGYVAPSSTLNANTFSSLPVASTVGSITPNSTFSSAPSTTYRSQTYADGLSNILYEKEPPSLVDLSSVNYVDRTPVLSFDKQNNIDVAQLLQTNNNLKMHINALHNHYASKIDKIVNHCDNQMANLKNSFDTDQTRLLSNYNNTLNSQFQVFSNEKQAIISHYDREISHLNDKLTGAKTLLKANKLNHNDTSLDLVKTLQLNGISIVPTRVAASNGHVLTDREIARVADYNDRRDRIENRTLSLLP